jgi:predicted nucleic acid-binding protein
MDEGPILCNAGPLIALSMVECLEVLERLYRRVLVPEAVFREIVDSGAGRAGSREIESASWIEILRSEPPPEPLLASELGAGEAAVIAAAHRLGADLVLLDERRARRIAEQAYNLRVKGSAGILVAAKRAGLISAVRPLLESMSSQGYFLSRRLVDAASRESGE